YDVVIAHEPAWKKPTKKKGADRVEPALDDFINASTRQPRKPCYREPATIFFGNDNTVSTHLECRPDIPGGCPRCKMTDSKVCCELCSPDDFVDFAHVDIAKPKQQPSRSRIAAFKARPVDMALKNDLHLFRKERTIAVISRASFRNHGAGAIMSDEVLDRIVECAHFGKIQTTADLVKETHWHRAAEDGAKILALIGQHHPIPVPPLTAPFNSPLRATTISNIPVPTMPGPSTPKNRKCRKCGLFGHIGTGPPSAPENPSLRQQRQTYLYLKIHAVQSEFPASPESNSMQSIYPSPACDDTVSEFSGALFGCGDLDTLSLVKPAADADHVRCCVRNNFGHTSKSLNGNSVECTMQRTRRLG
ncbi:hypothetical protein B0H10DRAFT_2116636, partial [Mycena sp. CBHHK59/15]